MNTNQNISNNNYKISYNLIIIAVLYTALLILSNLTASKITQFCGYNFTAAIFLFPFTYIIDDVLTEVYGFKISRIVIWLGLFANLIVIIGALIVISMPSSEHFHNQESFENVFGMSLRILLASTSAYLCGEFLNAFLLAKMKIYTKGKHFWARALFSTVIAAAIDTGVFMFVSFAYIVPGGIIFKMIYIEYFIKIIVEILILPITYKIIIYLKKTDGIDVYDHNTNFNPFSLKLD